MAKRSIKTFQVTDVSPHLPWKESMKAMFIPGKWITLTNLKICYCPCIKDAEGDVVVKIFDDRFFFEKDKLIASFTFPVNQMQSINIRPSLTTYEDITSHPWKLSVEVQNHNLNWDVTVGSIKATYGMTLSSRYNPPKKLEMEAAPQMTEVNDSIPIKMEDNESGPRHFSI